MRYTRPNQAPLYWDDTQADIGSYGLPHIPKGLDRTGPVLTRSIERPAVRAGVPCPHCQKGSMFLERQMHDEPELVCQACSYNEVTVALPALLELAGELEIKEGGKTNRWTQPASNGVEL